jgi:hypothetical protein
LNKALSQAPLIKQGEKFTNSHSQGATVQWKRLIVNHSKYKWQDIFSAVKKSSIEKGKWREAEAAV